MKVEGALALYFARQTGMRNYEDSTDVMPARTFPSSRALEEYQPLSMPSPPTVLRPYVRRSEANSGALWYRVETSRVP